MDNGRAGRCNRLRALLTPSTFFFRILSAVPDRNAQPDRVTTVTGRTQTGRTHAASGICHLGAEAEWHQLSLTIRSPQKLALKTIDDDGFGVI